MPKRMVGKRKIRSSEGSRKGMRYVGAGGEKIMNEGEVDFPFESVEGHRSSMVFSNTGSKHTAGIRSIFC